jgi:hypothetical protein
MCNRIINHYQLQEVCSIIYGPLHVKTTHKSAILNLHLSRFQRNLVNMYTLRTYVKMAKFQISAPCDLHAQAFKIRHKTSLF